MKEVKQEVKQINVKIFDERFYQSGDLYMPSVTYMLSCAMPTSYGLVQWIGDMGNKRAEEIKEEAGEDGSYVHDAIDRMIKGEKIKTEEITEQFKSKRALKVLKCLKGFTEFWEKYKPEVISSEFILWDKDLKLAGTADFKCKLNIDDYKEVYIIDWKTSKSIHDTHKVQLSLYKKMDKQATQAGLVHLGNTTKAGWSFLPLKDEDKYLEQGLLANKMFQALYPNAKPSDDVFPEYFSINN